MIENDNILLCYETSMDNGWGKLTNFLAPYYSYQAPQVYTSKEIDIIKVIIFIINNIINEKGKDGVDTYNIIKEFFNSEKTINIHNTIIHYYNYDLRNGCTITLGYIDKQSFYKKIINFTKKERYMSFDELNKIPINILTQQNNGNQLIE